jgi:hypothetical protein
MSLGFSKRLEERWQGHLLGRDWCFDKSLCFDRSMFLGKNTYRMAFCAHCIPKRWNDVVSDIGLSVLQELTAILELDVFTADKTRANL